MDQFSEYNELFPPDMMGMFLSEPFTDVSEQETLPSIAAPIDEPKSRITVNQDVSHRSGHVDGGVTPLVGILQLVDNEPSPQTARRRSSSSTPSKLHRGNSCETCLSTDTAAGHCKMERRRHQNRLSQQKFREKKEARLQRASEEISTLQACIDTLRDEKSDLHKTNMDLRLRIRDLERLQIHGANSQDNISPSDVGSSPYEIAEMPPGGMFKQNLPGDTNLEWASSSCFAGFATNISYGITNVSNPLGHWLDPEEVLIPSSTLDFPEEVPQMKS